VGNDRINCFVVTGFFVILRTIFTPKKSSPSLLKCVNKHPSPADYIGNHVTLFSGGTLLEFQAGRLLVLLKDTCGFGQSVQARPGMLHRSCNLNSLKFTIHVY
jgi:hypothetical protein